MAVQVHPSAAAGFSRAADRYESGRPPYPTAAVDWLADRVGLQTGLRVVELGAGTGKFTRILCDRGAMVRAVEPVAEMADRLRATAPTARVVAATAEVTGLPGKSADLVAAAQAFHWFANEMALAEIHRLLRPGGNLALVWNRRDRSQALWAEVERLIEPLGVGQPTHRGDGWRAPLRRSGRFGPLEHARFHHDHRLDRMGFRDRVLSISYVAALDERPRRLLQAQLDQLWCRHVAPACELDLPYLTDVYVAPRA